MSASFDLVIFDLDGTLVDSESLAERVVSESASQIFGKAITPEEIRDRFRGRTLDYLIEAWSKEHGQEMVDQLLPILDIEYPKAVTRDLKASDGAARAIETILPLPVCVASNGILETIRFSLEATGLDGYFGDNLFSASMVARPKPDPDLFLLACEKMGATPQRTIVIEDTVLGVEAGLAAGLTTVGYVGNHPESFDQLAGFGVPVIFHMKEFPQLVLV